MKKLENWAKKIFLWFFFPAMGVFFLGIICLVSIDYKSFENWLLLMLSVVTVYFVLRTCIIRVAAVQVVFLESLFTGRFEPEPDEFGCSVPIKKTLEEGLYLKWPWHKPYSVSHRINSLLIEDQRYDIENGAVILSGVVQYRVSSLCTYRALAISKEDIERGMSAVIDQVLVSKLIISPLKDALLLKNDLREAILDAFNNPAEIEVEELLDDGSVVRVMRPRKLFDETVSVADHRYGIEITDVNIDQIDPIQELQDARSAIQVEQLRIAQAEEKMRRFAKITTELKLMFPLLSDEQIGEKLELIEGLSTKEKKTYGFADLEETGKVVAGLVALFKGTKGN